jgi:hypothetical protein
MRRKKLDCGLGTQEVFVWVCHTQKHKTNLDCGLGTQEVFVWVCHTQNTKRISTAGWARRRLRHGMDTCHTGANMQETVIHAEARNVTFAQRENKEFSKASNARKIVIRSDGRPSPCKCMSQFGHVKTEKRKNKRKTSNTGVRELKLACFIKYGGRIACTTRFGKKQPR